MPQMIDSSDDKSCQRLLFWKPCKEIHPQPTLDSDGLAVDGYDLASAPTMLGYAKWYRELKREKKKSKQRKRQLKDFLAQESKGFKQRYAEYLKSDKWQYFRNNIIAQRHSMCERCGQRSAHLNVHHLSYVRIGNELPSDVKVYCLACHKLMHPGWQ